MYYVIDKNSLYNRVDEEVSRVADEAYTDDGTPLYDAVVLTLRDKDIVYSYMDDAVNQLVRRAFDICKYEPANSRLYFYVPDLDTSMETLITEEISRYVALYAANAIFLSRRAGVVPQYTDRVQSAMDKAIVLLKSRKAPNEQW